LRNLILKSEKINEILDSSQIGIKLLSGSINQIEIEGYIFDKQLNLYIDGLNLNIFVPFSAIDKISSHKIKSNKLTTDDLTAYSYKDNKINGIFSILEKLQMLLIKISNININFFIDFQKFVYKFSFNINELNSDMKKISDHNILNRKITMSTFSMTMTPYYNKDNEFVEKLISNPKNFMELKNLKSAFTYKVISDISLKLSITARKFRFDRTEIDFTESSMKEPQKLKCLNKLESNANF